MVSSTQPPRPSDPGPAWDVARLFPNQGQWAEWDYLYLNRRANRLVELVDGYLEVLEMPTKSHQRIVSRLHRAIEDFATARNLGQALFAPYPLKVRDNRFREPDVVFALTAHAAWLGEDFATGADLVVEVLSEDRNRDLITKRDDYAAAKIAEYWIVDPRDARVTVLRLTGAAYTTLGEWGAGDRAHSAVLPGFEIAINDILAH